MTMPLRSGRRSRLRSFAMPLILGLVCLLVYNANLRVIGAGDTIAVRYLPLLLWHDGTIELSNETRLVARGHPLAFAPQRPPGAAGKVAYFEPTAYWMMRTREHQLASFYPVVTPLLVAPLYFPAVVWLDAHGWEQPQVDRVAELMEKLAASIIAAVASMLMYGVLRRDGYRWAVPLTLAFAFGTNTWMISSQALWQHGTAEVLIASALLLILSPASRVGSVLLGVVCVLMEANRPPDGLVAGAIGLYFVYRCWRTSNWSSVAWLIAGAIPPLAALLYYNLGFIGELLGGYALVKVPHDFLRDDWSGLAGVLVSPTRGLLVFSPFLILAPWGLVRRLRDPGSRAIAVALGIAAVSQIVLYARINWRGGECWGPRYMTDILPILVWMVAPAAAVLRPIGRGLFVVAIVASICMQIVGAFWYTKTSDEAILAGDPTSMRGAWDPHNTPFFAELRHPPAGGELQCNAIGSIDRVGHDEFPFADAPPRLEPGAMIQGWALACGRSPAQLALLMDGVVVGSTTELLPRPDVAAALHTQAPSGWHMSANLWGVPPGERVLQLAVRVEPRSDFRIVLEQRVFVIAQQPILDGSANQSASAVELEAMAAQASALLREHQTGDGAWLTAFTPDIRYEAPQQEMNTFLTAMLVDLLAPLPRRIGLDTALTRARAELAAQIEADGRVRYHGLPTAPTIGKLGCAITPDADDTALAWRIAGPGVDDPRRQRMLDTLARYLDARGFYRTWLAPVKDYQCIDPGGDPNPTDVGIQMHVYLTLHEFDPPAAKRLCGALQRSFRDGDVWVYYSESALIPYLRAAELDRLGCNLSLPAERLALPVAGQEIWSEAARRLVDAGTSTSNAETREAIRNVLTRLAADDFAVLRRAPPLLYHNDRGASVRRFYWSEDFGYALWLRLYAAAGLETGSPRASTP